MKDGDIVWVLSWKYGDGSGFGVVRAYSDKQRADEDMDLLIDSDSGKQYELTDVPVYSAPAATTDV